MTLEDKEDPSVVLLDRRDELGYRLHQQSLLGEFGRLRLQTSSKGSRFGAETQDGIWTSHACEFPE